MADQQPPEAPHTAPPDEPHTLPDEAHAEPDEAHPAPDEARTPADAAPGGSAPGGSIADGEFEIGDSVIAKIANMACREVEGVHALGGVTSRALSSLRVADTRTQGVTVDLRGADVDVDITLVVTYGRSIPEVAQACRERVRERIEAATGLVVKAVNVVVSDIYFPEGASGAESGQA
jgi:uncharacterized alkaline shock family protein YloU